jgi:hypothetical protein
MELREAYPRRSQQHRERLLLLLFASHRCGELALLSRHEIGNDPSLKVNAEFFSRRTLASIRKVIDARSISRQIVVSFFFAASGGDEPALACIGSRNSGASCTALLFFAGS